MLPEIHVWHCPRRCGWYREYRGETWWQTHVIEHPAYGPVRQKDAVEMDIKGHTCYEYLAAKARLGRRESGNSKSTV